VTENNPETPPPASADAPAEAPTAEAVVEPESTADARIAALETEKAELRDRMLRLAAEFDNFKKRARRELTDAKTQGREDVLKDMLEVIDNLERATAAFAENADPKGIQQGISLVLRLFQGKLERYEVRPVNAQGQAFDPRVHEALSQVPSSDVAPGTIITVLQKGYRIGERLLRPSSVVVAVAPPTPPPASTNGAGDEAVSVELDAPAEGGEGGGNGPAEGS
jgi:molecular chaperone GrpE